MREALEAWLGDRRGVSAAITELRRIATGNSRAMWYVELDDGARFVARVEQGGVFGTSSAEEFRVMLAARRLGCPVAEVLWMEPTGTVVGAPFFVMAFVDGVAMGRDDRSMSAEVAEDLVRRLDALHRTQWWEELADHEAGTDAQIDRWLTVARGAGAGPQPLIEEGAAWLRHHAPAAAGVSIVHGDPGPGNLVHDGSRVLALTDWEFSHLGDPMEDWVYLVSMRGSRTMPREEWLALFERVAGVTVTAADLRYWSVFNYFKGACANLTCRRAFVTSNRAPNMALIGTALQQTFARQMAGLIGADDAHD